MNISNSARYASSISIAVVMLSGCGSDGSQTQLGPSGPIQQNAARSSSNTLPFGPPNLVTNGAAKAVHPDREKSWMAPDAKKSHLLYIGVPYTNDVNVYKYPIVGKKATPIGTLTGFNDPQGECVDIKGNVWIVNQQAATILEYAHGGTTPIATLNDPDQVPVDCSVDPTTGNLAVSNNFNNATFGPGSVSVYQNAQGTPQLYSDPSFGEMFFLCYDNMGNLFVDGLKTDGSSFQYAELPQGSSTFTDITLNQNIGSPGGVQWDGKHVAIGDQDNPVIYETSGATVVGTISLTGASDVGQFYITSQLDKYSKVVAANNKGVDIFKYPSGGSPKRRIAEAGGAPSGTAISK